jgi:low affinity Fe/Cu permease
MKALERFTQRVTLWAGSSWALLLAVLSTLAWLAAGPVYHFSDTWQLTYNTFTSLVTFLMVFVIQRSQNKDSLVIHTKLNELLAATQASNRLIDLEDLTEDEVRALHERYQELAKRAARAADPARPTSIERLSGGNGGG